MKKTSVRKRSTKDERRYKAVYENSMDAILITAPDGQIYNANPAACRLFKMTENQIITAGRKDLVDLSDERLPGLLEERARSGRAQGELKMIRKDGSVFPAEISSSVFSNDKGEKMTVMIIQDLSEQKRVIDSLRRSEENYRTLIEKSGIIVCFCSVTGKLIMINKAAANLFGGNPHDFTGKNLTEVFGKSVGSIIINHIKQTVSSGETLEFENRVRLKDGIHWCLSSFTCQKDNKGNVIGVMIFSQDITTRKRTEKLLRRSKTDLKRTNEKLRALSEHLLYERELERNRIARDLHDDLGQKLTAINLDIGWVRSRMGVQSSAVRNKFDEISSDISETIESVREVSSVLRPSILYELGIIPAFKWQLKKFSNQSGIKYHFESIPETMILDETLSITLYRILQEALTNIIKHSGATLVKVSLKRISRQIKMLISDNGKGISEDEINSLTSMGLEGIRERVKFISGRFLIRGVKGSGTNLEITIPIN